MSRPANPHLPQALAEAAAEIFAERGLAATRVEDITQRAGASKGAFYMHFDSKEALYLSIAGQFLAEVLEKLQEFGRCIDAHPLHSPASLAAMTEADQGFCDFLWERRRPLAMVLEGARGTPSAHLTDDFLDTVDKHFRESMAHHQSLLPPGVLALDPEFLSMMATGILFMFARRVIHSAAKPEIAGQLTLFRRIIATGMFLAPMPLAARTGAGSEGADCCFSTLGSLAMPGLAGGEASAQGSG